VQIIAEYDQLFEMAAAFGVRLSTSLQILELVEGFMHA